jgi:hypothetical protein
MTQKYSEKGNSMGTWYLAIESDPKKKKKKKKNLAYLVAMAAAAARWSVPTDSLPYF